MRFILYQRNDVQVFEVFDPLPPITPIVRCCKLNYARVCGEHLFGQVSTRTGPTDIPFHKCAPVKICSPTF